MGPESRNGLIQYLLITRQCGVQSESGERFFDVITEIDWPKTLWAKMPDRMTFAIDQMIWAAHVFEACVN
jgi:hypothetical protein